MSWLVIGFVIQMGLLPAQVAMYPPPIVTDDIQYFVQMQVEARAFDLFYLGGSLRSFQWRGQDRLAFFPDGMAYVVEGGIRWGPFDLGWIHHCQHPVMPFLPIYHQQTQWEGGYDEISLKISGDVRF